MRRIVWCLVLCLLPAAAAVAAAESPEQEQEPPVTCNTSIEEIVEAFRLEAENSAAPPCPTTTTCQAGGVACTGTTPCAPTGGFTYTDTGEHKCDDGSPPPFTCSNGETIHIVSRSCQNCPCCFSQPACFCPAPSCTGVAVVGYECR